MNARIDHVTDARDTRPAFGITYRLWSEPKARFSRVQADNVESAVAALRPYVGHARYSVTSIRVM